MERILWSRGSTKKGIVILGLAICGVVFTATAQSGAPRITGTVFDPAGKQVSGAHVEVDSPSGARTAGTSGDRGEFSIVVPDWGPYTVHVEAAGFSAVTRKVNLRASSADMELDLERVSAATEEVVVMGDVSDIAIESPDPSEKVLVREELVDASPGRPGAPVSIPGMPIETASGGIKAPQYFVPGVAGDHGEPIAQYIAVGGYMVPNNLSANAHGNGYADPNIYIPAVLGSVETDGGAFNVLEGNHALNLAAIYSLRPGLRRFVTLTGDDRDMDLTAAFVPSDPGKREWLALEANYGNGLMKTLEHRQQYKWNATRVCERSGHEITLLSVGYWGQSHEGNLVPLGLGLQLNDTIDPRQKDQTHTAILAVNDRWRASESDEVSLSGFVRTFNLALFSNFGEGLIRQSEFRNVEGAQARETHTFRPWLEGMAGADYNEDDIHRDNLDHYFSGAPSVYGRFVKVLGDDIAIRDGAPYAALRGEPGKNLRFYLGLRADAIGMKDANLLVPTGSMDEWNEFLSPKATMTWTPATMRARWLPSASFSIGQAYFTQDPRISVATDSGTGRAIEASPIERSHSEQLVVEKSISGTELRLTLGRTTTTATLAKIDPDTGLAENEGPGMLKYLTASMHHRFSFGTLQTVFSKADARDDSTGIVTPEAPRTIFDALMTLDRLPAGLRARGEYGYVGHKLLDVGNPQHPSQFEAIAVGETRVAVMRPFANGRLELGANGMAGRGYTGQTTETFAPGWQAGDGPPSCAPGVNGISNDFDCGTVERSVGVRMVSWIGGSISWRFNGLK